MTTEHTPTPGATLTHVPTPQLGVLPTVRRFVQDNVPSVAVALSGVHGAGREMLLDATDWRHISEDIGPWWQVVKMSGVEYVISSSAKAIEIAHQTAKTRMLFLARYLIAPGAGLNVRFANGNRLDCRRTNLVTMTRSEHSKANGELQRAKKMRQWAETAAAMATANAAAAVETAA